VVLRARARLGWLALLAAFVPGAASAQHITVDGTLSRAQTLTGPHYWIGAKLGYQAGGNLFQSFGIFGLTPGEIATFTGPASVVNIIGRVTGGQISSIDGTINSKIAGANVYLINPYGVVFGSQGKVDVSGSFYASTANYIKMANGARFQATHPNKASTLTAARPAAFGFLDARPPAITVNGSRLLARGTIGLVGGPVLIRKAMIATPAGTIDVASVAGKGEAPINPRNGEGLTVKRFGRVNITGGSKLDVGNPRGGGHAGGVFVRSGSLVVSASTIEADSYGAGVGGEIVLEANGRIALRDGTVAADSPGRKNGDAGDIFVTAGSLSIENGGVISAGTAGTGRGGDISVDVSGLLTISGAGTTAFTGIAAQAVSGKGSAGDIFVKAGSLSIAAGGVISAGTFGAGAGGDVSVDVARRLTINGFGSIAFTGIDAQANPGSTGSAGAVSVTAGTLVVVGSGEISAATFGTKNAGTVSVSAGVLLVKSGGTIYADAQSGKSGRAGAVSVTAGTLVVGGGGDISAATYGTKNAGTVTVSAAVLLVKGSGVILADAESANSGSAGAVSVTAGTLVVVNGGDISAATFGTKNGGTVTVSAGVLLVKGGGAILADAESVNSGRAGAVSVTAGTLVVVSGGSISASTFGSGNGGSVSVSVAGHLAVNGAGSTAFTGITAQAERGSTGAGGDVRVTAGTLSILDEGEISGGTFGSGKGGTVSVAVTGELRIKGEARGSVLTGISSGAERGSTGNAGDVHVTAAALLILDNGEIGSGTFGAGTGGDVFVAVTGRLTIDGARSNHKNVTGIDTQANAGSTNDAGDVFVRAGSLSLLDGGGIESAAIGVRNGVPASTGSAGKIVVTVAGRLLIEGAGSDIATTTDPGTGGNAGSVEVRAGQISIADGAEIVSTSTGTGAGGAVMVSARGALLLDGGGVPGTEIAASATGPLSGAAGLVMVTAGSLTIEGGAEIASTTAGSGIGGGVSVDVSTDVVLAGPVPEITAQSTGSGDAGMIAITADRLLLNGGAISTGAATSTASGGNISLSLRDMVYLIGGAITTSVQGETGNGGNITIAAPFVILSGSEVTAQAIEGHGGNITIDAGQYIPSTDSIVSASSALGVSGNVVISGPRIDLNGTLVVLSSELRSAVAVTRASCAAPAFGGQSSLVEAGRGGLPEDPVASLPALFLAGRDLQLGPRVAPRRADAGRDLPSTLDSRLRCG
jgi:filamentous hemagglutinin family protein